MRVQGGGTIRNDTRSSDAIEFATNSAKFLRRSVFDIRSIRIYSSFIFPPSWREEDSHTPVQEEFITWREF